MFKRLSTVCKIFSRYDILTYFSNFARKQDLIFHANWRQFARNVRSYFLGKNEQNIINLSTAELAQRVVNLIWHIDVHVIVPDKRRVSGICLHKSIMLWSITCLMSTNNIQFSCRKKKNLYRLRLSSYLELSLFTWRSLNLLVHLTHTDFTCRGKKLVDNVLTLSMLNKLRCQAHF